jgi:hypothetical protein
VWKEYLGKGDKSKEKEQESEVKISHCGEIVEVNGNV